jgi:uncharacterized SAM-dependent methyltransferase
MADGLFNCLERALASGTGRWSLNLEGQDPRDFLFDLVEGLKGNEDGHDKRIENRHRYVGLGPTLAWLQVCRDPSYPVMYDGSEAFARLWDVCRKSLSDRPFHYVSLGVGTGDKDRHILDRLQSGNPELTYIPIDISGHMLRLGAAEAMKRMPGRVLPIEMDFEDAAALPALRTLLDDLFGDDAVLFSLLGNSLANVDDETAFLSGLATLLRPQDCLALEVATTSRLDASAAKAAAEERSGSRSYSEFVTAALSMYTDLTIDNNWLRFRGQVDDGHAIRVEGHYVNCSQSPIMITMPNRIVIPFRQGESIQVLLGRKYHTEGLRKMLRDCHLSELAFEEDTSHNRQRHAGRWAPFGLGMVILKHEPAANLHTAPLRRVWEIPEQQSTH